jgi:hypothetical protein
VDYRHLPKPDTVDIMFTMRTAPSATSTAALLLLLGLPACMPPDALEETDAGLAAPDAGAPPDAGGVAGIWRPKPGTTWQWQLTGAIDTSIDAAMYDVDLFDAPQASIDKLHADGRVVICHFSAGVYEPGRPDSSQYPEVVLGNAVVGGAAGTRWVDIRKPELRALLLARMDLAVSKHCDGIEPSRIDVLFNETGFGFNQADSLQFPRFLAREGHARNLSVGMVNDLDQIVQLGADFDWALTEACDEHNECPKLAPFTDAGKAVFNCEYRDASFLSTVCASTEPRHLSTILKDRALDASVLFCP